MTEEERYVRAVQWIHAAYNELLAAYRASDVPNRKAVLRRFRAARTIFKKAYAWWPCPTCAIWVKALRHGIATIRRSEQAESGRDR